MTPDAELASSAKPAAEKPKLALAVATAFGAGYLKPGPGTWGSLVGVLVALGFFAIWPVTAGVPFDLVVLVTQRDAAFGIILFVALSGVWAASRVAKYFSAEDPQIVVVDEVSGQLIAVFFGLLLIPAPISGRTDIQIVRDAWSAFGHGVIPWSGLLAAFILFRLFDIWKPWPIRHLEKLPGGWGIMADDWLAGIYAAILLRLALHFNLL
ncbi:MAG TPA: phosphatidylglycerophosphatase A [Candidatus Dormibacteraeota bacterium]|nr:phosphatidylglycerophosphatase A [Candidatus Dormibacteraeota bacterium]